MEQLPSQQPANARPAEAKRKKTHSGGDRNGTSPPRRKKKETTESPSASTPTASCSDEDAYAQIGSVFEAEGGELTIPLAEFVDYLRLMKGCNRQVAKTSEMFADRAPLIQALRLVTGHPGVVSRAMQARLSRLLAALS
jgi:hypothetical protein